jgi:hypothetical protein
MKILWTKHAKERQKEWEKKLGISRREVEQVLQNPEQIVGAEHDVMIAQSKRQNGIIRIIFKEKENIRKILTLYWTSKVLKYWKEEK